MIFPVGAPIRLNPRSSRSSDILAIKANRERNLIAVISPQSLLIFQSHPQLVLASITRDEDQIKEKGTNLGLSWKPDSAAVCVSTTKNHLLLYRVQQKGKEQSYMQTESGDSVYRRTSQDLFLKEFIPKISLQLSVVVRLTSPAICIVPLREELLLCLQDGWLYRLYWNGTVLEEYSVHISGVPFSHDQLQSRTEYLPPDGGIYISSAAYSPLIGGFSLVLSNGRAALLTCPTPKFHPKQLLGVWAPNLDNASCTAVNHKYRLLSYGCSNSEIVAYHLDEVSGALIQAYRVRITAKDNPECVTELKAVKCMEWSPYGTALACSWSGKPVSALISTFGAQLWCSVDAISDMAEDEHLHRNICSTLDWGPEAYQLWFGDRKEISVINTVKTISLNNPTVSQLDHVCLMGSEEVFLSPNRRFEQNASAPHSAWNLIQMPSDYMANCWPLRYCAIDWETGILVIAGSRGLSHCNFSTQKWRLFGNETQEREIVVSGGLGIWNKFIVAACYDTEKQRDDFRFYPVHRQLDNLYCTRWYVEAQILMISLRDDVLVTFDVEARISLFQLSVNPDSNVPGVTVTRCAEVLVSDMIFHPACVISVQLTALNHDSTAAEFCAGADTLLVNVAGRLVTLSPQLRNNPPSDSKQGPQQQLQQPLLVASYVEEVWHNPVPSLTDDATPKPHLSRALWIQCGSRGMKVWMPLFPGRSTGAGAPSENPRAFISKRIMLPFELGVYPLVICSRDCLAYGVESLAQVQGKYSGHPSTSRYPSWQLHRNSEVFLHHILRQLLKRNLGLYALEIAATCRSLPYFGHVLELLLHQVLEEEATSSEPIPDPLLPRIIAFIQEFPEFLQTVAHCARKTELALWQQLFATAGNPKDLFEACIHEKKFDTAASFLIILQNMETAAASKEHATLLLEASLEHREWTIARDIVRFLRAIDPSDIDSPPRTPLYQKPYHHHVGAPRLSLASPNSDDADAFVFHSNSAYPRGAPRQRHSSTSASSPTENIKKPNALSGSGSGAVPPNKKTVVSKTASGGVTGTAPVNERRNSSQNAGVGLPFEENSIHVYLNLILNRHARELIADYRLADLGRFAAHLDFHLVLWLGKERNRSASISDFPAALTKLHADFNWPYPLLSSTFVDLLSKKMAQMASPSHDSSTNGGNLGTPGVPSLRVITRRNSTDSGVKTLDLKLSKDNMIGDQGGSDSMTKQLLMKQQNRELKPSPRTMEAQLVPRKPDGSIAGGTEMTEESWSTPTSPSWDAEILSNELDWEGLEQLCGEAAARGPQTSEAELRFLQQLMVEAGCLEWSILLCILLRDLVGLARAINMGNLPTASEDTLRRIKIGIGKLESWADRTCVGYKPLLVAVKRHMDTALQATSPEPTDSGAELNGDTSSLDSPDSIPGTKHSGRTKMVPFPTTQATSGTTSDATKSLQDPPVKSKPGIAKSLQTPPNSGKTGNLTLHIPDQSNPIQIDPHDPHPGEGIHVDIVSPMTPTKEDEQCNVM